MTQGSVPIPTLGRSLYEAAKPEERLKAALDALVDAISRGANWKVRKKTLLDIVALIDLASDRSEDRADGEGEEADDAAVDDLDHLAGFNDALPLYVGAVLERLGETRLSCVEQAAFYMLSAHPEHHAAAVAWIGMDRRHARDFRKFMNANRYYNDVLHRGFSPPRPDAAAD
jgi:hypothetical protein